MRMNKKGFTLVELMIVLAILGLLAGIGVPQYMKTLENSREATDKANIGRLQSAVDAFNAETGWWVFPLTGGAVKLGDDGEAPDELGSEGDEPKSILTGGKMQFSQYWTGNLPEFNSKKAKDTEGAAYYVSVDGKVYIGTATDKVIE
jgi:prepilin-type N-terminal cleavage/methylation domain-containing protein